MAYTYTSYERHILWISFDMVVTSNDCRTHYKASLTNAFKSLLENEDFVDMTLSAGGKTLRAHKVVLSACSSYFKNLLKGKIGILV